MKFKRQVSILEDTLYVGRVEGTVETIDLSPLSEEGKDILIQSLKKIEKGISFEKLKQIIINSIKALPESENLENKEILCTNILNVIQKLTDYHAIEKCKIYKDNQYKVFLYMEAVHKVSGKQIQKTLNCSTVLIVGCGGIGSNVAINLARMGIKHFILVDHDIVDTSNITRQIFNSYDVGMKKIHALSRHIRSISRAMNLSVETLEVKIDHSNLKDLRLKQADIIVWAIDTPKNINKVALKQAMYLNKPIIFGGFKEYMGYIGPFFTKKDYDSTRTKNNKIVWNYLKQVDPTDEIRKKLSYLYETGEQVSFAPLTQIVSGYITNSVYVYITAKKNNMQNVRYLINSMTNEFKKIDLK